MVHKIKGKEISFVEGPERPFEPIKHNQHQKSVKKYITGSRTRLPSALLISLPPETPELMEEDACLLRMQLTALHPPDLFPLLLRADTQC